MKRKLQEMASFSLGDKKPKIDLNNNLIIDSPKESILTSNRLNENFFNQDCLSLCKSLLGKYLVRKIKKETGQIEMLIGKIVEVEAYLGGDDKASHSFNNKVTERCKAMFMKPGTAYVYNIYGCYCCFNISAREPGAGVLIRALEPIEGFESMKLNRNLNENLKATLNSRNFLKILTNGPSKLCLAMNITKNLFNELDLSVCDSLWVQQSIENFSSKEPQQKFKIISAKRIGIDNYGKEAANKLYRFYIKDNFFVSIKSKEPVELDY